MKSTILFIFTLLTVCVSQYCVAHPGDDKAKATAKSIEKERYLKMKQDEKFLKDAKKQYWASQSKQVRKTIKQTNKRNAQNQKSNVRVFY